MILLATAATVEGTIGRAALRALYDEVALYPKPGLVSPVDSGSHDDMTMATFVRSLFALRGYFRAIAAAGAEGSDFSDLRTLGLAAETRMMAATGGVNTHRGAIFGLGLLAAAAGWLRARGRPVEGRSLAEVVAERWGDGIAAAGHHVPDSNGARVGRRYGAGGARGEALEGFPTLLEVTMPQLTTTLRRTGDRRRSMVQALFATMAVLEDTNLLHRGGLAGLNFTQNAAGRFLATGGVHRPGWDDVAVSLHRQMVARHLSPGGSADLLAAALFVRSLAAA